MVKEITIDNTLPDAERLLKRDGFLRPMAFICTNDDNFNIDLIDDDEFALNIINNRVQEINITPLLEALDYTPARKVVLITEILKFNKPDDMSLDKFNDMCQDEVQREFLDKQEAFSIVEVTVDHVKIYMCSFDRTDTVTINDDGRMFYNDDLGDNTYDTIQQKLSPSLVC